jgi:uncharacterized membrane protein
MLTGVRSLGNTIPPIFVVAPLGLLSTSVFDFVHLMGGSADFANVAYWMILGGLTAGVAMVILAFVDQLMLPDGSREKKKARIHLTAYVTVLVVYGASAYVRGSDPAGPQIASTVLATFGSAVALFGATIGAELVSKNGAREREQLRTQKFARVAAER